MGAPRDCASVAEANDSWGVLLSQVARAPAVDPSNFIRVAGAKEGLAGKRLGHFAILERLGEGGMGVVYKALDENLERLVALKLVRPRFLVDSARQERLLREARSAAAVNHPNIAAIYEVGEADGVAFIAMEYVDGKPLRSLIQDRPLCEPDALRLAIDIARGLARAHDVGIVHRDLKPDNLLVDRDGHAKILDFGLAKALQQITSDHTPRRSNGDLNSGWATRDSQILGTPSYMSPEQADGRPVDARSDVYSFGILLHELLAGRLPEVSTTQATVPRRESVQTSIRLAHGERVSSAPASPALNRIIQRCLYADRARRFANGGELLDALLKLTRRPRASTRWKALAAMSIATLGAASWVWWYPPKAAAPTAPSLLGERRLTANPPENMVKDAALAPDGNALAYVDQGGVSLRRIDPPSTEPLHLPEGLLPNAVSWYPDSQALLVSAWTRPRSGSSLWKINTRSGAAEPVSDGPLWFWPRISPDGESLAWINELHELHWRRFSEGSSHVLVVSTGDDMLLNVAWSPNGKRLAYVRIRSANKFPRPSLETIDLDGAAPRVLLEDQHLVQAGGEAALGWAPDGRLVYGLADWPPREPGTTLWSLPVDPTTGEPVGDAARIGSWTSSVEGSLTMSNSGQLAFQRYLGQLDVYVTELLDGGSRMGSPRRLTMTELDERPTDWTPDSARVIFMSNQNGSQHAFAQDLTSSTAEMLTSGPAWHTWPRLAGNGLLLFWQLPADADLSPAHLMRMQLPGGAPSQVLTAGEAVAQQRAGKPPPRNVQFRCSIRAASCVLSELEGNELRFSSFDPMRGPIRELARTGVERMPRFVDWDLSPDGKRIVLPRTDGSIRLLELTVPQQGDRMIENQCHFQFAAWSADGSGVFLSGRCPGSKMYKLVFAELSGPIHVLQESSNEWVGNPIPSPDGKRLAFALKLQKMDVWLLPGF
jgi:serine/threonine protein kinase